MYTILVATEIVNGLTWTLKTVTEGSNTYQILEATEVTTVRTYSADNATKGTVKYLDIH